MGRAPCCDKANVKRGPWSPEEDAKLKAYIEEHGTGGNWIALPHKIGLKRCGKSCRLRWLNYLRPNIKHGGFSEEEDNIICNLYISIGSRWSIIAAQLPGRTDNDIKNYWNTRLKKKLLGRRKESSLNRRNASQVSKEDGDGSLQPLSSSAIERMQLHMQLQGIHATTPLSFFNNPALWPKYHPLGLGGDEKFIANQVQDNNPRQGIPLGNNVVESPHNLQTTTSHHPQSNNGEFGTHYSTNMLTSTLSSVAFEVEKLNQNLSGEEFGGIYCGKNGEEQQVGHDLDCLKALDTEKDDALWWGSNNGFCNEKSSSSSWDSAAVDLQSEWILQDQYTLGYNI